MSINHRYDFVLLFDVKDGNPNGDPDAGNLPRLDPEKGQGLTTDVSLKRKIRNYVGLIKQHADGGYEEQYDIYIKEKAVLGRAHFAAFEKLRISLGQETVEKIPNELADSFENMELPEGMESDTDDDDLPLLRFSAVADKKDIQAWIKETKPDKPVKEFLAKCPKNVKARKPKKEEIERGREQMCRDFFDIRTFGAVLSLRTAPNCGQVRGPVQMTFARSIDPIVAQEHSITRMAVATEAEAEKQEGDNRTMGRKHTVPYGLYRAHGFVSAFLAKQTGFSEEDLQLLWQALTQMFEHDRSAARGEMATRRLYVFKHDSELGSAPAHKLFDLIQANRKDRGLPARGFGDYEDCAPKMGRSADFPGVELQSLCP